MKTVYFVRHGETLGNLAKAWQGPNDELSPQGFIQAETLAKRLAELQFDAVFCSSFKRAVQTAEVVAKRTGIAFSSSDYFVEVRNPSSTYGVVQEKVPGNEVYEYIQARDQSADKENFRYSDEETIAEVVLRARQALEFLAQSEGQSILVISHGTILKTITSVILSQHDKERPAAEIFYSGKYMQTTNTGITVAMYDEAGETWSLLTFNDHAHFAE